MRKRQKLNFLNDVPLTELHDSRLWSDKYSPQLVKDLPVVKKKVQQVRDWFEDSVTKLLVINGPAGCAKSTMVQLLAKEQKVNLVEFLDDFSELERWLHELKYSKGVGLIDQLPHSKSYNKFQTLMDSFHYSQHGARLIVLITDFPQIDEPVPSAQNMFSIKLRQSNAFVSQNPVIKTTIGAIIKKIHLKELQFPVDQGLLEQLLTECHGDLRLALNQLQFQSFSIQNQVQASKYRESSYSRFHVVGKLMYAKGDFSLNELIDHLSFTGSLLQLYVHENLSQFATLDSMEIIMEALSLVESMATFDAAQSDVLLRYVLGIVVQSLQASRYDNNGFRPLKSTRWFNIERQRRINQQNLTEGYQNTLDQIERLSFIHKVGFIGSSSLFQFKIPQVNAAQILKDDVYDQEKVFPRNIQYDKQKVQIPKEDWFVGKDDIED